MRTTLPARHWKPRRRCPVGGRRMGGSLCSWYRYSTRLSRRCQVRRENSSRFRVQGSGFTVQRCTLLNSQIWDEMNRWHRASGLLVSPNLIPRTAHPASSFRFRQIDSCGFPLPRSGDILQTLAYGLPRPSVFLIRSAPPTCLDCNEGLSPLDDPRRSRRL